MVRKKEHRQRGKKRKSTKEDDPADVGRKEEEEQLGFVEDRRGETSAESTSWLLDKRPSTSTDASVPFGLVESDLKAYLRSAHTTLQEHVRAAEEQERLPLEDEAVKALRNAMLDEIKGKELVLATDTDTSVVLEDLLYTFGERQARILAEALVPECFTLVCHRFGSHVVQSLLAALQYFVGVEQSGGRAKSDLGGLRTAEQLVLDISEAVQQRPLDVIRDQFASHVLRTLLLVLAGRTISAEATRSRRSKKFHEASLLATRSAWSLNHAISARRPASFAAALSALLDSIKSAFRNEKESLRSMCVDPIGSPTLSLIVELDGKGDDQQDDRKIDGLDLLDACLDGIVSMSDRADRSAHVETLIRDSVGTHLLEQLLQSANEGVIERFWQMYAKGRLTKLGAHPTANFVMATLIRRLSESAFEEACEEVQGEGNALVQSRHLGVLTAMLEAGDRLSTRDTSSSFSATATRKESKSVWRLGERRSDCLAVCSVLKAFGVQDQEEEEKAREEGSLLLLLLSGKTAKERKKELKGQKKARKEEKRLDEKKERKEGEGEAKGAITLQGSLLCQAMARLPEPANSPLIESILQLQDLLPVAGNPIGVHALLATIESTNLAFAQRSRLSAKVLEELEGLLNDKFGSRLCDSTFDRADLFFKEKMARQCLSSERQLLASAFGRFFLLKRVQLSLYRKDVGLWKQTIRAQQQQQQQQQQKDLQKERADVVEEEPARKKAKRSKAEEDLDTILAGV